MTIDRPTTAFLAVVGLGLLLGFVGYVVLDLAWAQHVGTAVVLAAVVGLSASVWARRPRR